jgi:hypothetical protein
MIPTDDVTAAPQIRERFWILARSRLPQNEAAEQRDQRRPAGLVDGVYASSVVLLVPGRTQGKRGVAFSPEGAKKGLQRFWKPFRWSP